MLEYKKQKDIVRHSPWLWADQSEVGKTSQHTTATHSKCLTEGSLRIPGSFLSGRQGRLAKQMTLKMNLDR